MSATNALETALQTLMFNNTALANIGDASGLQPSATAGSFWVSLLESDPGETGDTTSEADYTGYARVAVARSGAGWDVTNGVASNAAVVAFPTATGGSNDVTHFGVHSAASGSGNMLWKGALDAARNVADGDTPEFAIGALQITLE
jgi:hypothetical protein